MLLGVSILNTEIMPATHVCCETFFSSHANALIHFIEVWGVGINVEQMLHYAVGNASNRVWSVRTEHTQKNLNICGLRELTVLPRWGATPSQVLFGCSVYLF